MSDQIAPDHTRAPFLEALAAYGEAGIVPFSTPGHKQGRGAPESIRFLLGEQCLNSDVPHGGGADDTHRTRGHLRAAERLAADAWSANDAAFLVNGSSTGNIAAMLATSKPDRPVIIGRNLHTSLLSGLILSGARPVYLLPNLAIEENILLDVPVSNVERALEENPDATAVMLVSPAYTGVTSNLKEIARVCARHQTPLFVDEAWGPHFPFHPDLPDAAVQSGASAAVTSIHKLLSGLTQSSLMTFGESRLSRDVVAPAISMIETTSPSALILASIDAARRQMVLHGIDLLSRTLALSRSARERLTETPGLRVVGEEVLQGRHGVAFDTTRILIDVHGTGMTGFEAEATLRDEHRIGVEMSDLTTVIVHITIGDSSESVDHMISGFSRLATENKSSSIQNEQARELRSVGTILMNSEQVMTPRAAVLGESRLVPLDHAAGLIAAEIVTPYPPGIPLVAPGERFSSVHVEYLKLGRAAGMYFNGPADPGLSTLRVVR